MASENTYFVIFDAEKHGPDEWIYGTNMRTFQKAKEPQEAVDSVVAEYTEKGYRIFNIQVFQRIMNGDKFFFGSQWREK